MRRATEERIAGHGGSGARAATRVLALAGSLVLAMAGCRKRETDLPFIAPTDVRIEVGIAGIIDSKRWSLLRVQALNRGADFRGSLEVSGSDDPVTYSAPVEIAGKGGAIREVLIPVRPSNWADVKVTFIQPGWRASFKKDVILSEDREVRLLAVSRGMKDLNVLESRLPGTSKEIKVLLPGDLVPEPLAYDAFQAIVLLGPTLADAPKGTVEALGRWVERGGTLVAFPGPEWASGLPPATLDLLGIDLGDPGAKVPAEITEAFGLEAAKCYYRAIVPRQGTRETGWGFSFISSRGAGNVLSFSLGPGDSFPLEENAPSMYRALHFAVDNATRRPAGASPFASIEETAAVNLFAMSGSFVPPRSTVAAGIAVYLALGFFLPWIVFNRRRRREWTYVAVVVAAGLASLGIYRFGLLSARTATEIEEVSIVRLHQDRRVGEVSSFLGLISPRHERRGIHAPGEARWDDLPQLLREEEARPGVGPRVLGTATIERRDGRLQLAPVTLYPNGMFYFRSDYSTDSASLPEISFEENAEGRPRSVSVRARGRARLNVYRAMGGQYQRLGSAQPGRPFTGELAGVATASPGSRTREYWSQNRQTPEETESWLVSRLVPALQRESIFCVSHEGIFPPGKAFDLRNGITIAVIEVPGQHLD